MGQLMTALMGALIVPLAKLQAALTVWLLRGLLRLLGAIWRRAGRAFMAAMSWAADVLYPDPNPHAFGDLMERDREKRDKGEM